MIWKNFVEPVLNIKLALLVITLLWTFDVGIAFCPASFHGDCKCDKSGDYYVTNCTDTNLDNANILEYTPVDTVELIFTGNNVADLPLNIFGSLAKYDKLKVIDLSNNHIQTVKGRTFHDVANVTVLKLNDNDIYLTGKDNHPRMFSNFKSLEELHLRNAFTKKLSSSDEYMQNLEEVFVQSKLNYLSILNLEKNEIATFPHRDFFCTLPSLRELRLSDNRLTQFNVNLKCLPHLQILDLSRNYIYYFDNRTLITFDSSPQLKTDLTDNPFRCDCDMVDLFQWLSRTKNKLVSVDSYRCKDGFPPQNIGRLLSNLTLNDLQCHVFVHDFDTHLNAVYVILSLIIVAMIVLVMTVIIYKNRIFLYDTAFRMSVNIRRKFQYDSLDKTEETEMDV